MKKLFLLLATTICVASSALAQTPIKYQGEVDLGCSLGVGVLSSGRVNIHTIQGIKVGDYFSTGVGFGADYYISGQDMTIPLFLNFKGYIPTKSKVTPYASLDLGTGIGVAGIFKKETGLNYVNDEVEMPEEDFGYQEQTSIGENLTDNIISDLDDLYAE